MDNEVMDKGNIKNKELRLRELLENFFDASISPEEMQELSSAARSMTSLPADIISDPELLSDLRLINEFSQFAASTLSRNAASTPPGLEERLSAHISTLAASSRRRRASWGKILSACAAAAAIALISVTGVRFIYSDGATGFPAAPSPISLSETAPQPARSNQEAYGSVALAQTAPLPATGPSATASVRTIPAKPRKVSTAKAVSPVPTVSSAELESEAEKAINSIPDFTDDAMRVMPAGIIADVDPSKILLQPMTTLSQTIDNIYESVAIVSEALSGVGMALQTVNTSLADLNSPI